jgi:BioD-like phosphotransacetylase family protein
MIAEGGIGRPIDEIALNQSLFKSEGVELAGVILNKVLPEKLEEIKSYVGRDLGYRGIPLLGVIPLQERLQGPTMRHIVDEIGAKLLCGEEYLENAIYHIIIGAMNPQNALKYFKEGTLLITPGDREDLILAAMSSHLMIRNEATYISGILLTGGIQPHETIVDMTKRSGIPVLIVDEDSYTAASKVHDLVAKVRPYEKKKIMLMKQLIREHVAVDAIYESIS